MYLMKEMSEVEGGPMYFLRDNVNNASQQATSKTDRCKANAKLQEPLPWKLRYRVKTAKMLRVSASENDRQQKEKEIVVDSNEKPSRKWKYPPLTENINQTATIDSKAPRGPQNKSNSSIKHKRRGLTIHYGGGKAEGKR
jgi:hypothetical protein